MTSASERIHAALLNLTKSQIDALEGAAWEEARVKQFQAAFSRRARQERLEDEYRLQDISVLWAEFWSKDFRVTSGFIRPDRPLPPLRTYRQSTEITRILLFEYTPYSDSIRSRRPLLVMELDW